MESPDSAPQFRQIDAASDSIPDDRDRWLDAAVPWEVWDSLWKPRMEARELEKVGQLESSRNPRAQS
jgi:hypothetical protein